MRSGNVAKQFSAIQLIVDTMKTSLHFPNQELLTAVVEHGLTCDNDSVREKSFRLVEYIYLKKRPFRWGEICEAVMTELRSGECHCHTILSFPFEVGINL